MCFNTWAAWAGEAMPLLIGNFTFENCSNLRFLQLVDANGKPLTGDVRSTAQAANKPHVGWHDTEVKWCGWSFPASPWRKTAGSSHGSHLRRGHSRQRRGASQHRQRRRWRAARSLPPTGRTCVRNAGSVDGPTLWPALPTPVMFKMGDEASKVEAA